MVTELAPHGSDVPRVIRLLLLHHNHMFPAIGSLDDVLIFLVPLRQPCFLTRQHVPFGSFPAEEEVGVPAVYTGYVGEAAVDASKDDESLQLVTEPT